MRFNLLLLSAVLVAVASANTQQQQPADHSCCLPMKWHIRLVQSKETQHRYLQTGLVESQVQKPRSIDVFVNHRRSRFEIRPAGNESSFVFWRGHMWQFTRGASSPRHLYPVRQGFRPSGNLAPFFFRCLASSNGFIRMSENHYRMTEPDYSSNDRRLGTVTDVFVVPLPTVSNRQRGTAKSICLLDGVRVTYTYKKIVPEKGQAIVNEIDVLLPEAPSMLGWPDQSLTLQTKAYRDYYHSLIRSGEIKLNRPHLTVPVTRRSGNSKLN